MLYNTYKICVHFVFAGLATQVRSLMKGSRISINPVFRGASDGRFPASVGPEGRPARLPRRPSRLHVKRDSFE